MARFRLGQVGLALCLMGSVLIGSGSACTCPHREEAERPDNGCGSHQDSGNDLEAADLSSVDDACVCVLDHPSPSLVSGWKIKKANAGDAALNQGSTIPDLHFIAAESFSMAPAEIVPGLSPSNTLKTLLPARAPPRL